MWLNFSDCFLTLLEREPVVIKPQEYVTPHVSPWGYSFWASVQVSRIWARFRFHRLKLKAFKSLLAFSDLHSYLEPTDPDDQEVDYDNIWEYDHKTGMIQSVPGISTHWTGLDFESQGLGPMATQQRWSWNWIMVRYLSGHVQTTDHYQRDNKRQQSQPELLPECEATTHRNCFVRRRVVEMPAMDAVQFI